MATLFVSGALANKPWNGGAAWTRLSWLLGLRGLGHDVYFVEELADSLERDESVRYFRHVTDASGLEGRSVLLSATGEPLHGLPRDDLLDLARDADLLVNISGHLTVEPLRSRFRRRIYVDLDPGYTQLWEAGARLEGHDAYFTVGENIGTDVCSLPTAGVRWWPTRQPVVLDDWPLSTDGARDRFTTIGSWRGPYGAIEYGGRTYGLKVHEFRRFVELPQRVPAHFEAALEIAPADVTDAALLENHGWTLVDPNEVAGDPAAFRRYVQQSGAEFSVAQGIYVDTNSGWFSDRSTRYLASGKPAVVQETGMSRNLPVGDGLLSFRTLEEAAAGAESVLADYDRHSRAARRLAEEEFDSKLVLTRFLEKAL